MDEKEMMERQVSMLEEKDRVISDLEAERDVLWYDNIEKSETNLQLLDKYKTQETLINKLMHDLAVSQANYKAALALLAKREREDHQRKVGGKDG